MSEQEMTHLSQSVVDFLEQNYGSYDLDEHVADAATLQAQTVLITLASKERTIPLEVERKISVKAGQSFDDAIDLFNYLYTHTEDFPEPSLQELQTARKDLLGSPLANIRKAVIAYAILSSDVLFVSSSDSAPKTIPRIPELTRMDTLGSPITHAGYAGATDAHASRLEVILRNDEKTRLIYKNVAEEQWQEIQAGGRRTVVALAGIRAEPVYRHSSNAEAQRHEYTDASNNGINRCEHCGEFTGDNLHICQARVVRREILDLIENQASSRFRSPLDTIEHTDADGNPRPINEGSLPELPAYVPLDASDVNTREDLIQSGGTVRLMTGREARKISVSLIRKLPHKTLLRFLEASNIPPDYDELDQVMFRPAKNNDDEAEFITYLPKSSSSRLFQTNQGVFLQHAGEPEPEQPERLSTSNSSSLNTRYTSPNGVHTFHSSLFPSVYELSTAHSRRSFLPFSKTEDEWQLPPLQEIINRLDDEEFVSFHFEHNAVLDPQGRFLDAGGHAYEPDFYKDNPSRLEKRKASAQVSIGRELDGSLKILGVTSGECSTCYDSGKCSHVGYALRQLPAIIKDQIEKASFDSSTDVEEQLPLPDSLAGCRLTVNDDGEKTLTFSSSAPTMITSNRLFTEEDDHHVRYVYASDTTAPHPTKIVKAARLLSQGDNLVVPTHVQFSSLYTGQSSIGFNATVEGTVTYTKDENGNLISKTRSLQCNCHVYARHYSCRHTRRVEERENAFLAPLEVTARQQVTVSQETDDKLAAMRIQDRSSALGEVAPSWTEAMVQVDQERVMSFSELAQIAATYNRKQREESARLLKIQDSKDMALFAEQKEKMAARFAAFEGVRYSENYKAFEDDLQSIKARLKAGEDPLGYETENVLNGVGDDTEHARKFGIELEVVFPSSDKYKASRSFAEELSRTGLSSTALIQQYHAGQETGWTDWSVEEDCTVDLEIVSPIMSDTPENWEQLQKVCSLVKKHGGEANYRTGSHVHISTGDYGRTPPTHAALLDEFSRYSDILYRLGSNPKTANHRGTKWCSPNIVESDTEVRSDALEVKNSSSTASYLNSHHSSAINMEASGVGMKSHTEIRLWDGTLDPKLVQMQVMLTAAMTEVAAQRVNSSSGESFKFSPQSEMMPLGTALESTFDTDEEETAKFREMLDRYFPRAADRKRFIGLWAMTRWQEDREV